MTEKPVYMQMARDRISERIARYPRYSNQENAIVELATTLEALDKAEAEIADANREVLSLIESIWRAEFRKDAPAWQPLPDLVGRITQLDNMYAGVRSQRDKAKAELREMVLELEAETAIRKRAAAQRDALWAELKAIADDPTADMEGVRRYIRTLIQPEPDPLADELRKIMEHFPNTWRFLTERDQSLPALARHGLAVKEVG